MTSADSPTEQPDSSGKHDGIDAGDVEIRQASVGSVTSERASISQSTVKELETRSAQFEQSSVFKLNAEHVVINQSAATFVTADDVRLVKSNAVLVRSKTATVEGDLKTVIFAGNATGNVHMMFDRDGALRFGAGLGATLIALGVLVRKLFK